VEAAYNKALHSDKFTLRSNLPVSTALEITIAPQADGFSDRNPHTTEHRNGDRTYRY
jgi:hypothetical protein